MSISNAELREHAEYIVARTRNPVLDAKADSVTVPAGGDATVDVRPEAGQTWLLYILACIMNAGASGSSVVVELVDATTGVRVTLDSASDANPSVLLRGPIAITHDTYIQITFHNASTDDKSGLYGYSYARYLEVS